MAKEKEPKIDTPAPDPVAPVVTPAPVVVPVVPTTTPPVADLSGVEVGDPQVLRPVDLPLVIKPANGGEWKNPEQAAYAKILNAAAYARPEQWSKVDLTSGKSIKDIEVARLIEIGTNPDRYYVYTGTEKGTANLKYNDKAAPSNVLGS